MQHPFSSLPSNSSSISFIISAGQSIAKNWFTTRMDILLLGSSLKSKLEACPLTPVPPETGDTWAHRCDKHERTECVRMTHWEEDYLFLTISPIFYVLNSSFVPHRKTENSTVPVVWPAFLVIHYFTSHSASKGDKRPTWSFTSKSANCEDMQCWDRLSDLWCSCCSIFLLQVMNQQKHAHQIL